MVSPVAAFREFNVFFISRVGPKSRHDKVITLSSGRHQLLEGKIVHLTF